MTNPTIDQKLDGISQQLAQLVRHVAEVRGANSRLESRFDGLESRFDGLEVRFENLECRFDKLEARYEETTLELRSEIKRTGDRISQKVDHFVEFMSQEIVRARTRVEEEAAARKSDNKEIDARFKKIDVRLDRIEHTLSLKEES